MVVTAVSHAPSSSQSADTTASTSFQYTHPMAVCTLADEVLRERLTQHPDLAGVIVAGLTTENIGIEQLVSFCVDNPALRFIVICGTDPQQAIGFLPGQSLLALGHHGVDDTMTIRHAPGKRPVLANITPEAVAHFRQQVTLIDCIGCSDVEQILAQVQQCIENNPGPGQPYAHSDTETPVTLIQGEAPQGFECDPAGYGVIQVMADVGVISYHHFSNKGKLQHHIHGKTARDIIFILKDLGVVTLFDHATYLGKELFRAERALRDGQPYVQDEEPFTE